MVKYNFVGYGSLLSHKSFHANTRHVKTIKPVIVKGYKRTFDISDGKGKRADVLNIEKRKGAKFNGVLFQVDKIELEKLSEREDWYNFEEVLCYDLKTGKKIGKCLVCVDHYVLIDKSKKLPNKKYFVLCREAAYHLGRDFGKMWDETTFTSSGKKISDWIKTHKDYDTIKVK